MMASAVVAAGFHILDEEPPLLGLQEPLRPAPLLADAREALEELPVNERQNQGAAVYCRLEADAVDDDAQAHREATALKSKLRLAWLPRLASRRDVDNPLPCRRPPIDCKTFEPLYAVLEKTSFEAEAPAPASRTDAEHPLKALDADCNVEEHIEKHLAGQFEWLITYPAPGDADAPPGPASEDVVYGCTFLRRNQRRTSSDDAHPGPHAANSYTLLATPIKAGTRAMHAPGDVPPAAPLTVPRWRPWLSRRCRRRCRA